MVAVVSAVISSHATATGGLSAGILSALGPATGVVIAVAALGASIAVTARRREPNLAVVQAAGADA
jgi:threonine/homoserine/homoserine lactone efflux protein